MTVPASSPSGAMRQRWRKNLLAVAALAAITALGGCDDKSKVEKEADQKAQALWDKLLTHCGNSYFYVESVFDSSGGLAIVQAHRHEVAEFQKVTFNLVSSKITEAESMNGLEFRGRLTMASAVYRQRDDKQWGKWLNGPASDTGNRNTDDFMATVLRDSLGDMFDMGGSGAMALALIKAKGNWYVARRMVDDDSALGPSSGKFYQLDAVLAQPVSRYDCDKADIVVPPPTPEQLAAQKAKDDAIAAQKAQAEKLRQQRADAYAAEAELIRDKDKGIAFITITPAELDMIRKASDFRNPMFYQNQQHLMELAKRFPNKKNITDDQYLAVGTTFAPVSGDSVRTPYEFRSEVGTKSLKAVAITSGPHKGEIVVIDARNFASNMLYVRGQ
jgi:hypothetical protein